MVNVLTTPRLQLRPFTELDGPAMFRLGADPAVMAAIGMFCGYCGTLMTPMAANFNMVPAALLELKDQYAVIKAQTPTAIVLLISNIFLLYFLAF